MGDPTGVIRIRQALADDPQVFGDVLHGGREGGAVGLGRVIPQQTEFEGLACVAEPDLGRPSIAHGHEGLIVELHDKPFRTRNRLDRVERDSDCEGEDDTKGKK